MDLEDALRKIADERGLIFVDYTVAGKDISPRLKVVVDTEKGVTVGELTTMTKDVKRSPVIRGKFSRGFQLEITSPGLDFPLTREYQFRRNLNRQVRIIHNDPSIPNPLEGVIKGVEGDEVTVETSQTSFSLELGRISMGKLILKSS